MQPGLDLLGLAHRLFPFERILREVPKECPIGWFWSTFGDSRDRFNRLIESGFRVFRIQMYWSDQHRLVEPDVLRAGLEQVKQVLRNRDVKLYISPSCEHAERNLFAVEQRLELVTRIVPYAIPVNNPWKGHGADVPGQLHEYHGANPGQCSLTSTDGTNIYDIDAAQWVRKYGNKEHPCFLWASRFNLREIGDPGQKPPVINNRKAVPSIGYLRSVLRLRKPMGEAPSPKFDATPFQSPNIYKTHAEDDQEPSESLPDETRENRPVLIIRPNVSKVDVITFDGKVIGRFPRYGSFPGGFFRYYAGVPGGIGLYGYELGEKAERVSGSEFVWFRAGNKIFGPVHPAFRAGVYRQELEA